MIAIIDYGMGNLRSVQKAFEKIGHTAIITRSRRKILDANRVVLPGVGAFKKCVDNLKRLHLIDTIYYTIDSGKPFLGICLGLQLLFSDSEEFGTHKGLDIIKGRVVRFPNKTKSMQNKSNTSDLKVPHIGWNSVNFKKRKPIFDGIEDCSYFYFIHSYYVVPEDMSVISSTTEYGIEFTSSIYKDNIFACQFHPEKSQKIGLIMLKNFAEL